MYYFAVSTTTPVICRLCSDVLIIVKPSHVTNCTSSRYSLNSHTRLQSLFRKSVSKPQSYLLELYMLYEFYHFKRNNFRIENRDSFHFESFFALLCYVSCSKSTSSSIL